MPRGAVARDTWIRRALAPVAATTVVAAALLSGTGPTAAAAAADGSTGDPSTAALEALRVEAALLVHLGAFGSADLPEMVRTNADQIHPTGDPTALLDQLKVADQAGTAQLGPLGQARALSHDVNVALQSLPPEDISRLSAGQPVGIPPSTYENALADLKYRQGSGPDQVQPATQPAAPAPAPAGAPTSVATSAPTTVAASTTTATPTTTAASSTTTPSTASPDTERATWAVPAAAGAGTGLFVVPVLVLLRRRRRRDAGPDGPDPDALARLLDAGRRMGASLSTAEIHRILLDEARSLADSDRAVVVTTAAGAAGLAAASDAALLAVAEPAQGPIRRVLETGATARTVCDDEMFGGRHAIAAVPLVQDGAIVGAVAVARSDGRRHSGDELDLLVQLVPLAAAALAAADRHDDVANQMLTDGLTGLANRRRLDRDLPRTVTSAAGPVGFLMIDVDHFKHYNDTNGHQAGDEALRRVAEVLRDTVRTEDVVYRYGGEEFSVLLPGADDDETWEVADRLRAAVAGAAFPFGTGQPGGRVTISVGGATADGEDPTELCRRADAALYEAKAAGRDRVVVEGQVPGDQPGLRNT